MLSGEARTAGGFYFSYHGDGFNLRNTKNHNSAVCQYTLSGEFVNKYDSINEAIERTGLTGVSCACRKHTKAGNWLWAYDGENIVLYEFPKYNHPSNRGVDMFSKNGEYVMSFISMGEAERYTNVSQSNISVCCRGKVKSAGGYRWRYSDENDGV